MLCTISLIIRRTVWPIVDERSGGFNKTGLLIAVLAVYNFHTRSSIIAGQAASAEKAQEKVKNTARTTPSNWLSDSLALGSLIFSLHCLLADPSTLIAWSWTGYPVKGPVPHLHGSLTHISQVVGLLIPATLMIISDSGMDMAVLSHPLWLAYGSASAFVMYSNKNWLGYLGGLNFAVFLMSMLPLIFVRAASNGKVALTYFTAWLTVCLLDLANIWTVAYAFVPGGVYLRERTDL